MISVAMLAVAAASLVLQGAAVWLLALSRREARAARLRQAERDAAMTAIFERILRVEPGTIARDIQFVSTEPYAASHTASSAKKQVPIVDFEAERRAEVDWYIRNGFPPPDYAPASISKDTVGRLSASTGLAKRVTEIR
jgi:hypothetical protein